MMMVQTHQEMQ